MAKSKKTRRSAAAPAATKKTTPKAKAAAASAAPDSASEQDTQIAFVHSRLRLPTPSEAEREVFVERFGDDECAKTGAQTRAAEVLPQARRLVVNVAADVLAHSDALKYAPARLSYLMDTIDELEQLVVAQNAGRKAGTERRSSLVAAEAGAKAAAAEAKSIFDDMLGGELRKKFDSTAEAAGNAATHEKSLGEWVTLGRELLANKDKKVVAMLAVQQVTTALVDAWDAIVKAYKGAQHDTQELQRTATDLPATNKVEGRVLLETSLLYNAFLRAKEKGADLKIPVLGPALLRIAKPSSTKSTKAKAKTPKKDEPAPPSK